MSPHKDSTRCSPFKFNHSIDTPNIILTKCSVQGRRQRNEDAFDFGQLSSLDGTHFVALYDGHGGSTVSTFLSHHLRSAFDSLLLTEGSVSSSLVEHPDDNSIKDLCLKMDGHIQELLKSKHGGSTALFIAFQISNQIDFVCANVGDSRCFFVDDTLTVLNISKDQTPKNQKYHIEKAGGAVKKGRVVSRETRMGKTSGTLTIGVSNSFGDFKFKNSKGLHKSEQVITCIPQIVRYSHQKHSPSLLQNASGYLVLGCDGIFDFMPQDEIVLFLNHYIPSILKYPQQTFIELFKNHQKRDHFLYKRVDEWSVDDCKSFLSALTLQEDNATTNAVAEHLMNFLPSSILNSQLFVSIMKKTMSIDSFIEEMEKIEEQRSNNLLNFTINISHRKSQVDFDEKDYGFMYDCLRKELIAQDERYTHFAKRLSSQKISDKLEILLELLLDRVLFDFNGTDNITVVLVCFMESGNS